MPFDFKKEFKELYAPKTTPALINVPQMHFIAVRGKGNPNTSSEYQTSVELCYTLAYALKMSHKKGYEIAGFFEYVVPPLEGFWWQSGFENGGYASKEDFSFISLIRLPEFITPQHFEWAKAQAASKKALPFERAEFFRYDEGLCVQCLHLGSYDAEPETLAKMSEFIAAKGYEKDINPTRFHHEIYLNDPRKCEANKLKTILRVPIRKI